MEGIDLRYLGYLFRIVAVMTGWMVRIRYADLRIGTIALLPGELEGDYARDIRLKGQNLQVEHELGMVGERRGDPYRPIEVGRPVFRYRLLGTLDFMLDLTDALEILLQAREIGRTHLSFDLRDAPGVRVEQAFAIAQPGAARGRIAALAEEALEDYARMGLGRKWGRRRRP